MATGKVKYTDLRHNRVRTRVPVRFRGDNGLVSVPVGTRLIVTSARLKADRERLLRQGRVPVRVVDASRPAIDGLRFEVGPGALSAIPRGRPRTDA